MVLVVGYVVWDVRIDGGSDDRCYSAIVLPDGSPVLSGNYGNSVYVAKVSPGDGSFVWQYVFAFPGDGRSNAKSLLFDPTDSTLVIGGTAYPYSGDDQACGFVAKVRDGSTVWMYVDSADGCGRREGFSGVVMGGDGHYYAYGTDYETYSSDLFTPSRRFVLKIDRGTGSKVWRYQPGGYSYTAATPLPDGSIVAVGFGADAEAQRVGADGGEIWSITPDNGKFWDVIVAPNGHPVVAGIKDGDFYVAQLQRETGGIRWVYTANGSDDDDDVAFALSTDGLYIYAAGYLDNGINGLDAHVVKLDTLGNLLWSYTYNGPFNSDDAFRTLSPVGGGIVAGGYSVGAGTGRDVLLLRLNGDGDTLWSLTYDSPYSLDDEVRAVAVSGGELYVCGNSKSSPTDGDILLLKVSDPTEAPEDEGGSLSLSTVGGTLVLEGYGRAVLYDVSGRKVKEVEVRGRAELRPGKGAYFLRFRGRTYRVILR